MILFKYYLLKSKIFKITKKITQNLLRRKENYARFTTIT